MAIRAVLALGSGGARGYAHIGVIEEVLARGYEIAGISGCSMGALVGGVCAAGYLPDYRDWVCNLSYWDVLRLVDISWSGAGGIRADRIMRHLGQWLEGIDIEMLPIPFISVATDLVRQREVWFQHGSLMNAIRASIAVPGVITPVNHNKSLLVDGGLVNPLPILPTLSIDNDLVIAVNVTALSPQNITLAQLLPAEKLAQIKLNKKKLFSWHKNSTTNEEPGLPQFLSPEQLAMLGKFDTIMRSLDITQAALASYKIAGSPPDVLIDIPKSVAGSHEFHRAVELIALGRHMAEKALDRYESGNEGRSIA